MCTLSRVDQIFGSDTLDELDRDVALANHALQRRQAVVARQFRQHRQAVVGQPRLAILEKPNALAHRQHRARHGSDAVLVVQRHGERQQRRQMFNVRAVRVGRAETANERAGGDHQQGRVVRSAVDGAATAIVVDGLPHGTRAPAQLILHLSSSTAV